MSNHSDNKLPVTEDLSESYRKQIEGVIKEEAMRRISESQSPEELERLTGLSLLNLYESNDSDLIPALMSRLGVVRAALDGHGGGLLVTSAEIETNSIGDRVLSLILDLSLIHI